VLITDSESKASFYKDKKLRRKKFFTARAAFAVKDV
jgi:hypothetical protein